MEKWVHVFFCSAGTWCWGSTTNSYHKNFMMTGYDWFPLHSYWSPSPSSSPIVKLGMCVGSCGRWWSTALYFPVWQIEVFWLILWRNSGSCSAVGGTAFNIGRGEEVNRRRKLHHRLTFRWPLHFGQQKVNGVSASRSTIRDRITCILMPERAENNTRYQGSNCGMIITFCNVCKIVASFIIVLPGDAAGSRGSCIGLSWTVGYVGCMPLSEFRFLVPGFCNGWGVKATEWVWSLLILYVQKKSNTWRKEWNGTIPTVPNPFSPLLSYATQVWVSMSPW